jgi:hypothetical protein
MSKGILQKKVEIQGLATAILLPSVGVFGGPIGSEVGELSPHIAASRDSAIDRPFWP